MPECFCGGRKRAVRRSILERRSPEPRTRLGRSRSWIAAIVGSRRVRSSHRREPPIALRTVVLSNRLAAEKGFQEAWKRDPDPDFTRGEGKDLRRPHEIPNAQRIPLSFSLGVHLETPARPPGYHAPLEPS